MAIVWRGMDAEETAHLTYAMAHSGEVLDWSDIDGPKVDKHSSGGVGDKTSLILVPLVAACGVKVPKMSGRGLGHSGGTLDKLESIPGYRVDLTIDEYRSALKNVGAAIAGQTKSVAPADKKLYALRDVTATVESVPLLTSSILCKKLAEGLDALVLDVKCGRGAFMKDRVGATALARSLADVARRNKLPTTVFLTSMESPLGRCVGNSLEVRECIETLQGRGPKDLEMLSLALAARMVKLAGLPEERVQQVFASGEGLEVFRKMIRQQGGDERVVDDVSLLPIAPHTVTFNADESGFITHLDAMQLGEASMRLGGGRNRVEDAVDHAVGLVMLKRVGDEVREGEPIIEVHYRDEAKMHSAWERLRDACTIGEERPAEEPLILDTFEA